MLTTNRHFDTGIIIGKIHCSRNSIIIGVVLKQIVINSMHHNEFYFFIEDFGGAISVSFLETQ